MIVKYYGVEDNVCEWNYLQGIIKHLTDKVDTLTLHIVSVTPEWDRREEVVLSETTRNVILAVHDEYMTDCILDEWKNRDDVLVFKSYLLPEQEEINVFPLPLGYNKKHSKDDQSYRLFTTIPKLQISKPSLSNTEPKSSPAQARKLSLNVD